MYTEFKRVQIVKNGSVRMGGSSLIQFTRLKIDGN